MAAIVSSDVRAWRMESLPVVFGRPWLLATQGRLDAICGGRESRRDQRRRYKMRLNSPAG